MLRIVDNGNILDSVCETLVCPTNTVGVMGKGLAKVFKEIFPKYFEWYRLACKGSTIKLGELYMFCDLEYNFNITTFPTKRHWQDKSDLRDIKRSLNKLTLHFLQFDIKSIAFPALGCGEGGLNFEDDILPLFEKMDGLGLFRDTLVELYRPGDHYKVDKEQAYNIRELFSGV